MRKTLVSIITFLVCVSLCACQASPATSPTMDPNEQTYQQAISFVQAGDFASAIPLFESLKSTNYKDSADRLLDAKYQYVVQQNNNTDQTAYEYMLELVEADYKDSDDIYNSIYGWHAEIAFSTYKGSMYHSSTINASNKTFPIYYVNFQVTGGPPNGDYRGTYEICYSDGTVASDGYHPGGGIVLSIVLSATQQPKGKTTFKLFDENGVLLATNTATIK